MLPALATKFAVATVLISAVAGGVAEDPTTLRESSAVVSRVPLFSQVGDTQCDADGNFYFNTSLSPSDSGLLKVAHDGSKFHLYKLPARDADSKYYHFREFNVTPSGELRVLAYGSDSVPYLFHFDSDLGDTSKLKLELPEHFQVDSFAAFESGAILVTGYFDGHADKEEQGKTYTAIFEASGALKAVVAGRFGNVDLAAVRKKLSEGGAALGEDGYFYLLRPDQVVVVSESGSIVRRMTFKKPSLDRLATRIIVSAGLIVVELQKDEGLGKELKVQYLVLNSSSGNRVGLFEPEPALGNNFLCFSGSTGFAFLTVRDDKVTLLTAPIR